jgi:hypothetical protein
VRAAAASPPQAAPDACVTPRWVPLPPDQPPYCAWQLASLDASVPAAATHEVSFEALLSCWLAWVALAAGDAAGCVRAAARVARYAAAVAPETAGRWLAHSDRIVAAIDSQLWPERELRDETLVVLGISDLAALLESTPPLDHVTAHAEAIAWVAGRSAAETATRTPSRSLSQAAT